MRPAVRWARPVPVTPTTDPSQGQQPTIGWPMSSSGQSWSPTPTLTAITTLTAQADGYPSVSWQPWQSISDGDRSAQYQALPIRQRSGASQPRLINVPDCGAHGVNA